MATIDCSEVIAFLNVLNLHGIRRSESHQETFLKPSQRKAFFMAKGHLGKGGAGKGFGSLLSKLQQGKKRFVMKPRV
ncbi:MAG: hypothetical protein Q8N60_03260, partial [Candidatus Diapherotrites archaeon]|nr:hypothetical protein [Candidatus Diapherotrites archaeon]